MSRSLATVRERHKPQEEGTRSTHGSAAAGFDPHVPINPLYGSQAVVEAERIFESDAYGLRLQAALALGGSWLDVLAVVLSGSTWVLLGTGQSSGVADWRVFDGANELAHAQSPVGATVALNVLVNPRGGATYRLQAQGSGSAVAQTCSLIAIRAFT